MKYKLILLLTILVPLCGKSQKKPLPKKTTPIIEKKYLQESVFNEATLNITGLILQTIASTNFLQTLPLLEVLNKTKTEQN